MAITYPLALPLASCIRGALIRPHSIVGVSESPFSGEQQVQEHPGKLWALDVTLKPLERADAELWAAWGLKLDGRKGTFLIGDPKAATPRGSARDADTPLVMGGAQTGNELTFDGVPTDATGYLKAGDYIQLGSGTSTRLYKVLDDADSNGSGEVTATIWPTLRTSPGNNDPITVENCVGTFRLKGNLSWDEDAIAYGFQFSAREAL